MKRFLIVITLTLPVFLTPVFPTSSNLQKSNDICSQIKAKVLESLIKSGTKENAPAGKITVNADSTASKIDSPAWQVEATVAAREAKSTQPVGLR